MTVRELESRIDAHEVSEWMALDRIDPIADPWMIGGTIASVIANRLGDGKRRFRPGDFIPRRREQARAQTAAQIRSIMSMYSDRPQSRA